MTKRQRIVAAVVLIKKNFALGAPRTAELDDLREKYELSPEQLRQMCLWKMGADYWN